MQHRKQTGFSIVELLTTLAVAILAVVIISSMYSSAGRLADRSDDLLVANSMAYGKLEKYENYQYSTLYSLAQTEDIPVEDFSAEIPTSLPGTREGKVYITPLSDTLLYIFVRVEYGTTAVPRVVEYGDFIQKGGLGR